MEIETPSDREAVGKLCSRAACAAEGCWCGAHAAVQRARHFRLVTDVGCAQAGRCISAAETVPLSASRAHVACWRKGKRALLMSPTILQSTCKQGSCSVRCGC